jgi:hypothetical protein
LGKKQRLKKGWLTTPLCALRPTFAYVLWQRCSVSGFMEVCRYYSVNKWGNKGAGAGAGAGAVTAPTTTTTTTTPGQGREQVFGPESKSAVHF